MYEQMKTRMLLTTAVLAAVAAMLAGPANAFLEADGVGGSEAAAPAAQAPIGPGTIPYLSHGIGVDESLFAGTSEPQASLGLTGDSPLTRVSAPEPEGLTGDSAATRYPGPRGLTATASSGDDTDWTWLGLGAGMAALVAAGLAGVLLSTRNRDRMALP